MVLNTNDLLKESTDKGWAGMSANTKIGHVHLHVSNLSNAMKFYHEILGLNLTATYPGADFLLPGNTITILQPIHGWEPIYYQLLKKERG
jgi:catechol-2,3-dioxygenase